MGINKLDVSIIERYAPKAGPSSSVDYNATLEETINSLKEIAIKWNSELQPLLDTLPNGDTGISREDRSDTPDPFANGFDGSQLYLDLTSTKTTDNGQYYDSDNERPYTIKETLGNIQEQLNDAIQNLKVEIANTASNTGITSRQKQSIGARIFDPEATSSSTSLDGVQQIIDKNVSQIELDIYGDSSALKNNGAQSLIYSILEQLQSLQEIHDYNSSTNDSSHGNLPLHAHKYKVVPVGDLNSLNKTYYLPSGEVFISGTLRVIVNGLEKEITKDYYEMPDNKGFVITDAHRALENDGVDADDSLWVHYDIEVAND